MGIAPPTGMDTVPPTNGITGTNPIAGFPILTLGVEGDGRPNTDGTFNGGSSKPLVIFVSVEDEPCWGITTTLVEDSLLGTDF
jgi:hypothetical protein